MMAAGRQDAWRAPDASNTPSFVVYVQLRTSSASISALLIHFATLQSRLQNDTKKNPGRWPPLDPKPRDLPTAAGDTRVDVSPEDQKCTPVQVATYSRDCCAPATFNFASSYRNGSRRPFDILDGTARGVAGASFARRTHSNFIGSCWLTVP